MFDGKVPARVDLRGCVLFGECPNCRDQHDRVVAYSSDLTDAQWNLLEPLLVHSSKRGPKHGADLRRVVDAMLYISHTGCQWRYLPAEFGPWTRIWSQFRRWSSVGWDEPPRNEHGAKVFRPIRHAWRVEVAHGHLVRRRRLARCFENTVTSATGWLHVASISEVLRAQC
jgi:transposase